MEPYLLASVLLASIAQRLVRKICPHCKEAYTPENNLLRYWKLEDSGKTFYRGTGCPTCNGTGFRGRVGIFEILINDEDVQNMILRNESAQAITRAMHANGKLRTLYEDARNKVLMGLTTLEEATRVIMS